METIIAILLTIIVLGVFAYFLRNSLVKALVGEYERSKEIIDEKLKSGEKSLESKKEYIERLVNQISAELKTNQAKLEQSEKDRLSSYTALKTVIEEHKIATKELKDNAQHLNEILSNNQIRGGYGEKVAKDLLLSMGLVEGTQFFSNKAQDTVSSRPDFTILLPDKTKINIDVKFPLSALKKWHESKDDKEKEIYLKQFAGDVKQKIKQVITRDYINPEENTMDFVILFVPNEMIFSFIYDRFSEICEDAWNSKVIMAGPFGFTAILRMVQQSYKTFKYQEGLQSIIKLIKVFEAEFDKFNIELDKLGDKLQSIDEQYNKVSITRSKKLSNIIDKIKTEESLADNDKILTLEQPLFDENE